MPMCLITITNVSTNDLGSISSIPFIFKFPVKEIISSLYKHSRLLNGWDDCVHRKRQYYCYSLVFTLLNHYTI